MEDATIAVTMLNVGSVVMQSTYAAVCEYLGNLKHAEAEQAEADHE